MLGERIYSAEYKKGCYLFLIQLIGEGEMGQPFISVDAIEESGLKSRITSVNPVMSSIVGALVAGAGVDELEDSEVADSYLEDWLQQNDQSEVLLPSWEAGVCAVDRLLVWLSEWLDDDWIAACDEDRAEGEWE